MKRRSNKSAKVPNVKLRPAQPQASSSKRPTRSNIDNELWAEETQLGSEDVGYIDTCPRPLKGLLICATGIQDSPTLFKQAVELGALTTAGFTNRVTHLIAESHGGHKYQCAIKHKVPIMHPTWITESHATWLRGDDVDLQHTLRTYRLPIFSGIVVSLSGIDNPQVQSQIRRCLAEQKGLYAEEITRPVKVTHLLCSGDEDTEKILRAERFNANGETTIRIVWEEWFWDCLKCGGRFDESLYDIRQPRPEPRLSQPELPPSSPPPSSPAAGSHSPDPDDEEIASVHRPETTCVKMWQSLFQVGAIQVDSQGKLKHNPTSESRPLQVSPARPASPVGGSIISKFRRANSFAPALNKEQMLQPFSVVRSASVPTPTHPSSGIFTGLKLCALGEAKSDSVKRAVENAGGSLISDEEGADYVIVRLLSGSKIYRSEPDPALRAKFRTECWLEQSIFDQCICAPDAHISFTPLGIETPIPSADKIQLSMSGLDEATGFFTRRLVRALGMALAPVFSRKVTHLLCPSRQGAKFDKAKEWDIPVVDDNWLREITRTGLLPRVGSSVIADTPIMQDVPMEDGTTIFQQGLAECPQSFMRPGPSTSAFIPTGLLPRIGQESGASAVPDRKGKGKAVDEPPMVDITNDLEGQTTSMHASERSESSSLSPRKEDSIVHQARVPPDDEEVPSSRTPSPMKMTSPVKMPPLLTMPQLVLLGKRRSEEGDERAEKRARPRGLRTKPGSRPQSHNDIFQSDAAPATGRIDGFDDSEDMIGMDEDSGSRKTDDDDMRVTYDDTERRKLMKLLDPEKHKPTTRKRRS